MPAIRFRKILIWHSHRWYTGLSCCYTWKFACRTSRSGQQRSPKGLCSSLSQLDTRPRDKLSWRSLFCTRRVYPCLQPSFSLNVRYLPKEYGTRCIFPVLIFCHKLCSFCFTEVMAIYDRKWTFCGVVVLFEVSFRQHQHLIHHSNFQSLVPSFAQCLSIYSYGALWHWLMEICM